ncbi:SAV_2336 N-terminal domain-related protein [Streptomyces sp. NPDC002888]|uniref:SAV_2336 N-terminal domain-related protein n=1 Tax=Streptomyces sp. NPDC002888 TaxID=3364668 RepID=UPI0036965123
MSDPLDRLLRALGNALPAGTDPRTLADALWLAASGATGEGASPTPPVPPEETAPDPEPERSDRPDGNTPPGTGRTIMPGTESRELSVRRPGATTTVRGVPLSLGRANPLPDALAVGRAIQPFRRPWRSGGHSHLDIEATVEHYARGGPLVPLFRPAPEPWFEAVVLVDSSLSMSVWEETTRAVARLLTTLGGLRAVHTWRLEWEGREPRVRDHHGREVPAQRVPHHGSGPQGRRLVLLVSDCAARGWHAPAPWLLLREWGDQIPVALLDPLPPRLWRRSALNLPAVRVTAGHAGGRNGALRYTLPPRLKPRPDREDPTGPWAALPVMSCTPRSLGAWASTLMRADPRGCDAVLVPATGRLPQTRNGSAPARQPDPARLAEAFAHTAPAPAVRLAVLCSDLPDLPPALLHVLRDEAVPEAGYADLAEVLTSGLFAVRRDPDGEPLLALHAPAREHLNTYLTTHDRWQIRAAFTRHAAAHPYAPQGIAAVLHDALAPTELPAEARPFAETVGAVRRQAAPVGEEPDGGPSEDGSVAVGPDEALAAYSAVRQEMRPFFEQGSQALRDAEVLLRHLIDYAFSRLPAPLGGWPSENTCFDDLRAAKGSLTPMDVIADLRGYPSLEGIDLQEPTSESDATGPDLVWRAAGGPLHITLKMQTGSSWVHEIDAAATSPIEFLVVLDESDKPEGLSPLASCATLLKRGTPPGGGLIVLRLQTRYGKAPRNSRGGLVDRLAELHRRAGSPTYRELVREAAEASPPVTLGAEMLLDWFSGRAVPADEQSFEWLTRFLVRQAGLEGDGDWSYWLAALRHHALGEEYRERAVTSVRVGHPIAELAGLAREPYVERRHDRLLRTVVQRYAAGEGGLILLVGPHGFGKAVSALEALSHLPDDWWLWHPDSSDDLAAALDVPTAVPSRTAVWLGYADYLLDDTTDGRGERIAARLRARLHVPEQSPVLVLGALTEESANLLKAVPPAGASDPRPQARALWEECQPIHVTSAPDDARMDRYTGASPGYRALLEAAIDARRCGHGPELPLALLRAAAPGYLRESQRQLLEGDDWLAAALDEASVDTVAGVGLLSRVGPTTNAEETTSGHYRLSDHIERHGRETRAGLAPPESLWNALADHASPRDLEAIARTAEEQGDTQHAGRFRALAHRERREATTNHEDAARFLRKQLQRTGLTKDQARDIADQALDWLRVHDRAESAQFVLNGLLPRGDLSTQQATEAVVRALDWLTVHGDKQAAEFVLGTLLPVTDLPEDQARRAVAYALRWLDARGDIESAQFVLRPFLLRGDLSEAEAHAVVEHALRWLQSHGGAFTSQFVLSAALRRRDLTPQSRAQFVNIAIDWLQGVGADASAKFLLRPLLRRADLTPEEARVATEFALDWLQVHGTDGDAQFVLNALLYRGDLTRAEVTEAGDQALHWLAAQGSHHSARYVLRPLLERPDLGSELSGKAVQTAMKWSRARTDRGQSDEGIGDLARTRAAALAVLRSPVVLVAEIANIAQAKAADRLEALRTLADILSRVVRDDDELSWESQGTGDGLIVLLPGDARGTALASELLSGLESALHDHAALSWPLRLRVALHYGEVERRGRKWHGSALTTAFRLVKSAPLRAALEAGNPSPAAVAVSDDLFTIAFRAHSRLAGMFRPVHIPTKDGVEKAWISVAGHQDPPGIDKWSRPPA